MNNWLEQIVGKAKARLEGVVYEGNISEEEKQAINEELENMTPEEREKVLDFATKNKGDTQKEFKNFLWTVHNIGDSNLSQEDIRKKVCICVDNLSEDTYVSCFPMIVEIIQRSKEKCKPFNNTKDQVDNILSWLPRLKDHEELLTLYIRERRAKYKLEV